MRRLAVLLSILFTLSCLPAPPATHDAASIPDARGDLPSCMPTTLSPAAIPSFPPSLSAPTDGDACNAASNNGPDQALLDGIEAARMMLRRGLASKVTLRSVNGTSVVTGSTSALAVTVGGVWKVYGPVPSQTFTVADLDGGGVFATMTYYYMYLSVVGGVLTRSISTTAPDANNYYKSGIGGTDYAYVGSFRTNLDSEITVFWATNGVYYSNSRAYYTVFTGVGPTMINLYSEKMLPPTSREAIVSLRESYCSHNTTDVELRFYPNDAGGTSEGYAQLITLLHITMDGNGSARQMLDPGIRFHINTSSDGKIKFEASANTYNGPTGMGAIMRSIGYVEH